MKPWIGFAVGLVLLSSASAEGALLEPESNNDGPPSSPGSVAAAESVDVRSEPTATSPETASTDQPPSAPPREPVPPSTDPPTSTDIAEPPPADDPRPATPVDPPVPVWCVPRLDSADYPGHAMTRPCPVPWPWPCPPPIDRIGIVEVLVLWPCREPPPSPCPLLPDIVASSAESGERFRKCPIPPPIPCKTLHAGGPASNHPEIWPLPCPPPPCPHPAVDGGATPIIWCRPVPPCLLAMDAPTTGLCPIPSEPPLSLPPWPAPVEPGDDTKRPLPIAPTGANVTQRGGFRVRH